MKVNEIFGLGSKSKDEAPKPRFRRGKAGCIPYVREGDGVSMAFMVTSDAAYGGSAPMIAKGGIDEGETPEEAGIREAEEELGLDRSNIVAGTVERGWSGELSGLDRTYQFDVFMCEVKSKRGFTTPGYETKEVVWLTAEEYQQQGRKSQAHIVKAVAGKIK